MKLKQVIESAQKLSDQEKLALIETVVQMLQRSTYADQAHFDPLTNQHMKATGTADKLDAFLDEATEEQIHALLHDHLDTPDPDPDQMLRFGMFKNRIPVDEAYFRMAEWHPSNEDLNGA